MDEKLENLKENLDKLYDTAILRQYGRNKSIKSFTKFGELISDIIEEFNLDLNRINLLANSKSVLRDFDPYIVVLNELLEKVAIKGNSSILNDYNPLYKNIFSIKKEDDHYSFKLKTKEEVLSFLNPSWVYNNISLVNEFMKDDNKFYNTFVRASKLFPISLDLL